MNCDRAQAVLSARLDGERPESVGAAVDALAWDLDLDKSADTSKLAWVIAFPLMFVTAMVLVAVADRLVRRPADE